MRVTIAVCTWNRAELLRQTLEQMTRLDAPAGVTWELLVVNNRCTDATDEVISAFESRLPLRHVFEDAPGLSNARNAALEAARGDYILYTDDDVLVDRGWLAAFAASAARTPGAAAFLGPVEPWFPTPPDPVLADVFPELKRGFCGIALDLPDGPLPDDQIHVVYGANMGFRMSAIGGLRFDPALGATRDPGWAGEEGTFLAAIRRRGGTIVWCPRMRLKHYVDPSRMTLDYLLRFSHGRGRTLIRRDGIERPARILGVPRWMWRRFMEESVKARLLALTPFRAGELRARRECWRLKGMIAECRALRREEAATAIEPRAMSPWA